MWEASLSSLPNQEFVEQCPIFLWHNRIIVCCVQSHIIFLLDQRNLYVVGMTSFEMHRD